MGLVITDEGLMTGRASVPTLSPLFEIKEVRVGSCGIERA
jgi:hypothetical protein